MLLVIDGYNVLFAKTGLGSPDHTGRDRLTTLVAQYVRDHSDYEAIIFFDSREVHESLRDLQGVKVRFAESADRAILQLLRSGTNPSECIVVTADEKDVGRPAAQLGAKVISPDELARRILRGRSRKRKLRNRQHDQPPLSEQEVEQWMRWFEKKSDK